MIIGITGTIGSGKTTVAEFFKKAGFAVVDADELSHDLLSDAEIRTKLTAVFGESILDRTLHIDRKKLAEKVFNNQEQLHRLNTITHKKLHEKIVSYLEELKNTQQNIVVDVALPEELNLMSYFDKIVLVQANLPTIYQRTAGKYTQKQVLLILNNQKMPNQPDYVIDNNTTLEVLHSKVGKIIHEVM